MGVLHVRPGGREPCGDGGRLFRRDPGSREADGSGGRRLRGEPGGDRHEIVGGGSGGGGHHAGGETRAGGGGGTHSGERGQGGGTRSGGPRTGDEPAGINRRGGDHEKETGFGSGPYGDARDQKGGNKPFAGLKILLLDYSTSQDQSIQDYEHMVEILGGVACNPSDYSSSTHIVVMGNIPAGARLIWENDLKEVADADWISKCMEACKLLPVEGKGCNEKLLERKYSTPHRNSSTSIIRKCVSTTCKQSEFNSGNNLRSGVKRRLIFHRYMHCAYESEEVESLYDYSLRFRLHELTQVPGCSMTLKLAKLTTKVVMLRCYSQIAKLHEEGFSLGGYFTSRNFMIYADDSIKFTNLADGAILSFSDSNGDLDYRQFVKMVQDEVFLKQAVPDDLQEWLRIVSQGIKACDRSLLANHIHLMEPFQGYGTFVSMYQQFCTIEGSAGWADLLNSLGHYDGWKSESLECSFLEQAFPFSTYDDNIKGLLRLVRNTFQHKAKKFHRFFLSIIIIDFPHLLSDFQRALHLGGYLSHLNLRN